MQFPSKKKKKSCFQAEKYRFQAEKYRFQAKKKTRFQAVKYRFQAEINFNPLPDDKILDWSKLKQFADDNFKFNENSRKFS